VGVIIFVRYQPVSPPPTKRIKHERPLVESSVRGVGRSGRVKAEAAVGSARHCDGRTSTPRSVIVISDTEDDTNTVNILSVFVTYYHFTSLLIIPINSAWPSLRG